eukprot:1150706-Pelagomonas_calceolata.AAC.10
MELLALANVATYASLITEGVQVCADGLEKHFLDEHGSSPSLHGKYLIMCLCLSACLPTGVGGRLPRHARRAQLMLFEDGGQDCMTELQGRKIWWSNCITYLSLWTLNAPSSPKLYKHHFHPDFEHWGKTVDKTQPLRAALYLDVASTACGAGAPGVLTLRGHHDKQVMRLSCASMDSKRSPAQMQGNKEVCAPGSSQSEDISRMRHVQVRNELIPKSYISLCTC